MHWTALTWHEQLARLAAATRRAALATSSRLLSEGARASAHLCVGTWRHLVVNLRHVRQLDASRSQGRNDATKILQRRQRSWEARLLVTVVCSWWHRAKQVHTSNSRQQLFRGAMLRLLANDAKSFAHTCVVNWRTVVGCELRARWQDVQRTRARAALELTCRQSGRGRRARLSALILSGWSQWARHMRHLRSSRKSARATLLRVSESDTQVTRIICMVNWCAAAQQAKLTRMHIFQLARARKCVDLLVRPQRGQAGPLVAAFMAWRRLAGRRQGRRRAAVGALRFLLGRGRRAAMRAALAGWSLCSEVGRIHASDVASRDAQIFQLEVDAKELFLRCDTQACDVASRDARILWLEADAEELHLRFDEILLRSFLARCMLFWKVFVHEAVSAEMQRQLVAARSWAMQVQDERTTLEGQLKLVYEQLDSVTETLKKEVHSKGELAAELRDLYGRQRAQVQESASGSALPSPARSVASSMRGGLLRESPSRPRFGFSGGMADKMRSPWSPPKQRPALSSLLTPAQSVPSESSGDVEHL